jgi:FkbM family methyltransferase
MTASRIHDTMASALPPLSRHTIAGWKPWEKGPEELLLRCQGSLAARALTELHARWPFRRGHQRLVRHLPRVPAWQRVPFRSQSGVDLMLDMTDSSFLYLSGRLPTEPLEAAILNRLVRPGDVFVDVGAHRGLYIAHLLGRLRPSGRLIAFEPSPSNAAFIRQIFGNPPDLEIHQAAVADTSGHGQLVSDGELTARLSLAGEAHGIEVPLRRLDEVVTLPSPPAACIVKIDVEGSESAVLRGARGLLGRGVPFAWLIESLPGEGARRAELLATLRELVPEAVVYGIRNGTGLVPVASIADDDPEVLNLLVLAPSLQDRLAPLRDVIR